MGRRITTAILAVVVAALVLVGIGTFGLARGANRDRELRRLETQASAIAELVPAGLSAPRVPAAGDGATGGATGDGDERAPERRARLRERVAALVQLSGVTEVVIGPGGRLVGTLPTGVERDELDVVALRSGETVSGSTRVLLWAAAGRTDGRGVTTVVVITARQEGIFGPTTRWFVVFAVVAMVLGAAVAWGLGRRLARPVHDATETTRRLAEGDLGARMPAPPAAGDTDELAVLARSVDTLASELERSRGLEQQFLLSVSHDLRTPLTSIRGYAEAIADGVVEDPAVGAEVILEESRRLERLVGDLLDLAQLDARTFRFHPTEVGSAGVVGAVARRISPDVDTAGLRLVVEEPLDVPLLVDVDRVVQAVGNLCTNAVHFARTTVWIRTRLEGTDSGGRRWLAIDVSDDGPGIPAADLHHVFERLYQAANQPLRKESGTGLGLAIARELTEGMGGEVAVASEPGRGTTCTLRFPIR